MNNEELIAKMEGQRWHRRMELARECLGLEAVVEHQRRSIYTLSAARDGRFDLILFLGLIYHLRHPLYALDLLWDMCLHTLLVESQVCDAHFMVGREDGGKGERETLPGWVCEGRAAQFYPSNELNGDYSNWFSPSVACLAGWLDSSGFEPELAGQDKSRAFFRAQRREMARPWWIENELICND